MELLDGKNLNLNMQEIKLRIVKFFMNKKIAPETKKEKLKIFSLYYHPDKTQ